MLLCASGCTSIRSTSMSTMPAQAYLGHVSVVSLGEPAGVQVGIIQTTAGVGEELTEVMDAFAAEAGRAGGDIAKVDRMNVTYEWVTRMVTQTYSCGTSQAPRTCTRTVPQTMEVGTLSVTGRAFRSQP